MRDAAELENREQRDPWRDRSRSDSATNRVVNNRQDEMYSRINKGNYIQKYKFYLTEEKNRHITRETGRGVGFSAGGACYCLSEHDLY